MGLITYDVSIDPAAPQVNITIGATASSITVTINSIGDFSVSAKPSPGTIVAGAIAGAIVGSFLGPAGALLGGGGGVGVVGVVGVGRAGPPPPPPPPQAVTRAPAAASRARRRTAPEPERTITEPPDPHCRRRASSTLGIDRDRLNDRANRS